MHDRARDTYHHGNLREALIQAALAMIAERGLAGSPSPSWPAP